MSRQLPWTSRTLVALATGCWALTIGIQSLIAGSISPSWHGPGLSEDHDSLIARLFGSSRSILSRHLFLEADRYFHKGIRLRADRAFSDTLLLRWADQIAPTAHEELEGSALSEIMPWLQMAIGSDPQNFEAWAAAGYWLMQQDNMTAAVKLMERAQRENPADYRFYSALGQLYYLNQDYAYALAELSQARKLWPRSWRESDEEHRRGLGEILTFQAGIHEAMGHRGVAIETYRSLYEMFPGRTRLLDRIAELESGTTALTPLEHDHHQSHLLQFRGSATHVHHEGCRHHPD